MWISLFVFLFFYVCVCVCKMFGKSEKENKFFLLGKGTLKNKKNALAYRKKKE